MQGGASAPAGLGRDLQCHDHMIMFCKRLGLTTGPGSGSESPGAGGRPRRRRRGLTTGTSHWHVQQLRDSDSPLGPAIGLRVTRDRWPLAGAVGRARFRGRWLYTRCHCFRLRVPVPSDPRMTRHKATTWSLSLSIWVTPPFTPEASGPPTWQGDPLVRVEPGPDSASMDSERLGHGCLAESTRTGETQAPRWVGVS